MSYVTPEYANRLDEEAKELESLAWSVESSLKAEDLREHAQDVRAQIRQSREHIRNYYGLALDVGMQVTYYGQPATLVGFAGQYIAVLRHGDTEPLVVHTGEGMEYPEGTRVGPGPDERFAHLVEVRPDAV